MSVTPQLKQLVAERTKAAAARNQREVASLKNRSLERKWNRLAAATMALVDRAAPFMDEGSDPTKWAPSTKLKLLYFVAHSCGRAGAEKDALIFIDRMLERARKLWLEGLHPDPWADEPKVRL